MTEKTLTGYAVAGIVNEMLTARELATIPPQMVYNYLRNGYITGKKGAGQKPTVQQAEAWATAYVQRRAARYANQA